MSCTTSKRPSDKGEAPRTLRLYSRTTAYVSSSDPWCCAGVCSAAAVLEAESLGEQRFREEYRRAWEQPWKRRGWGACAHLMLHGAGDVGWGPELGLLPNTRLRSSREGAHQAQTCVQRNAGAHWPAIICCPRSAETWATPHGADSSMKGRETLCTGVRTLELLLRVACEYQMSLSRTPEDATPWHLL